MALADHIYELFQHPTFELRIGGVLITADNPLSLDGKPAILAMRGGERHDEDSRVATPPYLEIDVIRIPSWVRRGMPVTLDAGYFGEHVRIFTGGVWALGDQDVDGLKTQCIGTGATDADGVRLERTASVINPPAVWPPIPAGQYIDTGVDNHLAHTAAKLEEVVAREAGRKARISQRPNDSKTQQTIYCKGDLHGAFRDFKIPARDLSGEDVGDAVEGVLDDAGIAQHNIQIGAYTLASEGATLDRMPGAGMLTPLLQLQGGFIRQLPSGVVIGRVLDEQPAPTPAFRYSNTDQDYARIIRVDPPLMAVPFNPLAQIWQTIGLDLDYLDVDGNFFAVEHNWEIVPQSGALSYIDLRGGEDFGGSVGVNPVASFTWEIALQAIGTELYAVITVIDTSTDGDGSIDQAASTWASNQTTIPDISDFDGEEVATIRIALSDIAGDFTITRHVEDNDGLIDDHTEIIDVSASSSAVTVPPFFVAAGTKRYGSPDGAQTKNTTTPSSKTCTAVGARLANGVDSGHAVYGHSNGTLDVTRDFNKTVTACTITPSSPGVAFTDVKWDWRDQRFVWALTDDARLYVSTDYGATFFLLHNLRTVTYGGFGGTTAGALGNDIGLPAGGGVYVHGGDGAGRPLIAYNTNPFGGVGNVWIRVTHLGDLLTDLATPADATMRIVGVAAPGYGGDTYILSWSSGGGASLVAIYHTNDPPGPARSFTRATGLTAGLKNGRVMMESGPRSFAAGIRSRIALFGDDDTWISPDGIAYTQVANNLPSGYTPNHGLYMSSVLGGLPGVYEHLLAVENSAGNGGVMKSTDEGETWNFILGPSTLAGWDTGAKAKKIATGAPFQTSPGGAAILYAQQSIIGSASSYERRVARLEAGTWVAKTDPAAASQEGIVRLRRLGSNLYRIISQGGLSGSSGMAPGQLQRSTDEGQNWSNVGPSPATNGTSDWGVNDVVAGADGTLYAVACTDVQSSTAAGHGPDLYRSDDDGATWDLIYEDNDTSDTFWRRFISIAAHPTNPEILCIIGDRPSGIARQWYTLNARATTPTITQTTGGNEQATNGHRRAVMLSSGRIICMVDQEGHIYRTDDYGAVWVDTGETFTGRQFDIVTDGHLAVWCAGGDATSDELIKRSLNGGQTWEDWLDASAMSAEVQRFHALAFAVDTIFLATNSDESTERVYAIPNAKDPANTSPAVQDITLNLDSVMSGSADVVGIQCLAAVAA